MSNTQVCPCQTTPNPYEMYKLASESDSFSREKLTSRDLPEMITDVGITGEFLKFHTFISGEGVAAWHDVCRDQKTTE